MHEWATVGFDDYRIVCTIGVYSKEKLTKQEILVDLRVNAKFSENDALDDAVNYVELAKTCEQIATQTHFHLLETYVQAVMDALFSQFNVKWAWIRVKKPQALKNASCSVVELTRGEK